MYGIAPGLVFDEMDARDVRDLFSAGIRFERCRGAIWLTALDNIAPAPGQYSERSAPEPPADPDEYQAPDRAGFYHAVKVMR